MNHNDWGYASFGKRDGFEVFHIDGILSEIGQGNEKESLFQALQLKLEEIRIFKGSKIFRLSQFEGEKGTIQLYSLFEYALDQYQRDGYRASCLAFAKEENVPANVWQLLEEAIKKGSLTLSNPFFPSSWTNKQKLYPNYSAFIPLYTDDIREVNEISKVWQMGEVSSFRTIYTSSSHEVRESIQERNMVILEGNPFWQAPQEQSTRNETEENTQENQTVPRKEREAPADSLVHAFESDADNRWGKQEVQNKKKPLRKESRIWGVLALVFIGILSSLLWISL